MGAADTNRRFVPAEDRDTAVVIVVGAEELDAIYRDEFPAFHSLGIPHRTFPNTGAGERVVVGSAAVQQKSDDQG